MVCECDCALVPIYALADITSKRNNVLTTNGSKLANMLFSDDLITVISFFLRLCFRHDFLLLHFLSKKFFPF